MHHKACVERIQKIKGAYVGDFKVPTDVRNLDFLTIVRDRYLVRNNGRARCSSF